MGRVNSFLESIVEEICIDLILEFFGFCEIKRYNLKSEFLLKLDCLELFEILGNGYKKRKNSFGVSYFF